MQTLELPVEAVKSPILMVPLVATPIEVEFPMMRFEFTGRIAEIFVISFVHIKIACRCHRSIFKKYITLENT